MGLAASLTEPGRPAGERSRRIGLVLLVVWALLCGTVLTIGWLLVHPLAGSVGTADDELALGLAAHRTPTLTDLAHLGQIPGNTVSGQVALAVMALGFSWWRRSIVPAVFVAVLDAGLLGIYLVATAVVPRQRPPVKVLDPGLVPDHSFPSGHVATSIAICGGIVVLTWVYRRTARWWVMPLVALPACVGVSRLYEGAHHLSDVLTSLLFATAWLAAVTRLVLAPPS
jgi:undecaprenyl-diphosphatase